MRVEEINEEQTMTKRRDVREGGGGGGVGGEEEELWNRGRRPRGRRRRSWVCV